MAEKKINKAKAKPAKPDPFGNSSVYSSDFAKALALVGSGPKAPKVNKINQKGMLIKGTKWAVLDLISVLRNTAHATKARHPRSTGKMFSDIAQASGYGDYVIQGQGKPPSQYGRNDIWYYPGGAPPGYPDMPPNVYVTIMESGTLWGEAGKQPWTDPGYPNYKDLEYEIPEEETQTP